MEHNRSNKHSRHKMWRTLKKYLKTEHSEAHKKANLDGIKYWGKCDKCKWEMREEILAEILWKLSEIDMSERAWTKELHKFDEEGETCEE